MKKYLVVKFKNAGLFINRPAQGYLLNGLERKKREDHYFFEELITRYQISNMVHVLFGERPVPSFRKVFYKKLSYYENKALDSFLRIESYKTKNKDGKPIPVKEVMSIKKDAYNSWNPQTFVYWERLRKLLQMEKSENPDEVYEHFVKVLKDTFKFKSTSEVTFNEIKKRILKLKDENPKIYNLKIEPLFAYLKSKGKMPVENYVLKDQVDINYNKRTVLMVIKGIDKVIRLSGTIIIPIEEKDIEKLRECSGYATLLDGGFVSIHKIVNENMVNTHDFTQVSEISTKTQPFKKTAS